MIDINLNINVTLGGRAVLAVESDDAGRLAALETLMSALSDKIEALKAAADAADARDQVDLAEINRQIADLNAKVESGLATPEDLAAIDALKARYDAHDLLPNFPAVEPPAPVEPPPAPETPAEG